MFTSNTRLWLDPEGNVVEEGDPNARELLASEGAQIPDWMAEKHGLVGGKYDAGPNAPRSTVQLADQPSIGSAETAKADAPAQQTPADTKGDVKAADAGATKTSRKAPATRAPKAKPTAAKK